MVTSQAAAENVTAVDEYIGGPGLSDKDAKLVKVLVTEIQHDLGRLSTEELLTEVIARSRPRRSPTHHLFEWDQAKGHALYLLERARRLIVAVRVIFVETPDKPVRAFPVVITDGKKGPMPMRHVLDDRDLTAALLEQAKTDLEVWVRRYDRLRHLAVLKGVFQAAKAATRRRR